MMVSLKISIIPRVLFSKGNMCSLKHKSKIHSHKLKVSGTQAVWVRKGTKMIAVIIRLIQNQEIMYIVAVSPRCPVV